MPEPTTPRPPAVATGPALGSTADATPYVAVSWMAVGAMGVAAAFVLVLLIGGIMAYRGHRPLIEEWALILPVVAVVLSFTARRIIRDAEGTRTGNLFGLDLPNAAWWTAVVAGLGYVAYLFAIDFSISSDARAELDRWIGYVRKQDEPDALTRAFYRTRDPNERASMSPTDAAALEGRWGPDYAAFRQCDLVRLAERNPGATFEVGGLRNWAMKPTGVDCVFSGTLTCPEGTFPVQVPIRGVETGAGGQATGRQWQVVFNQGGYVQREQVRLTPYGWMVIRLEATGDEVGRAFARECATRGGRLAAFGNFTQAVNDPVLKPLTQAGEAGRYAALGCPAAVAWYPGPDLFAYTADKLFRFPAGVEPRGKKEAFVQAWGTTGIVPAGTRLDKNIDSADLMTITDTAVEVRVPVEIPLPSGTGEGPVARGRVVVVSTDPTLPAELSKLRAAANPTQGGSSMPDDIRTRAVGWKVVAIESDLKPIQIRPQGPGGPGGPGMDGP